MDYLLIVQVFVRTPSPGLVGQFWMEINSHKDKASEYGKDVWMKHTLPTLHVLCFGIQAKKGKLDSAGMSKEGSSNIAEILNQTTMMLPHEIFDPEVNRRVLVDHASSSLAVR